MVRLLVPTSLEAEFQADSRFQESQAQTVGNLREALDGLSEDEETVVFIGAGVEPLASAVLADALRPLAGLDQAVLLLLSDTKLIWANALAEESGLTLEAAGSESATDLFDGSSRRCLLKAIDHTIRLKVISHAILLRGEKSFEATVLPAGDPANPMAAVVLSVIGAGTLLYERADRLARVATSLFPEDAEALVRLPAAKRIDLIKELIKKTVKQAFDYDDFILRTLDAKTGQLEPIMARSGMGASLSKRSLAATREGGSIAGYVAATGEPYLVVDSTAEKLWISDLEQIQSAVVVPLKLGSKVVGTFAIESRERYAFDRYDLVLASILGGYITSALDMADLIGLGQSVMAEQVTESVVEEVAGHLKNINESISELRRHNIGDSIAVTSRLENILASTSDILDAILKGARKVTAAVAPPIAAAEEILSGKRILVADDEPSILQSLGDILRSSGCEVFFARDGSEAVEMATSTVYDLVISDIKMPKMSGYEVYSSVKAKFPETSVILMTAYGYDPTHSIVKAKQEGLDAVLYKPFRAETLKKALRQAFQKKGAGS